MSFTPHTRRRCSDVFTPPKETMVEVRLNSILKSPKVGRDYARVPSLKRSYSSNLLRINRRRSSLVQSARKKKWGSLTGVPSKKTTVRFNDIVEVKRIDDIENQLKEYKIRLRKQKKRKKEMKLRKKKNVENAEIEIIDIPEKSKKVKFKVKKEQHSTEEVHEEKQQSTPDNSAEDSKNRTEKKRKYIKKRTLIIQISILVLLISSVFSILLPSIFVFIFESHIPILSYILVGNVISQTLFCILYFSFYGKKYFCKFLAFSNLKREKKKSFINFIQYNKNVGKTTSISLPDIWKAENGNPKNSKKSKKENEGFTDLTAFSFPLTDPEGKSCMTSPKVSPLFQKSEDKSTLPLDSPQKEKSIDISSCITMISQKSKLEKNEKNEKKDCDVIELEDIDSPCTPGDSPHTPEKRGPNNIRDYKLFQNRFVSENIVRINPDDGKSDVFQTPSPPEKPKKDRVECSKDVEKSVCNEKKKENNESTMTKVENIKKIQFRRKEELLRIMKKRTNTTGSIVIPKEIKRKYNIKDNNLKKDEKEGKDINGDDDDDDMEFKVPVLRKLSLKPFGNLKNIDNPVILKSPTSLAPGSPIGLRKRVRKRSFGEKKMLKRTKGVSFNAKNKKKPKRRKKRALSNQIIRPPLKRRFSFSVILRSPKSLKRYQMVKIPKRITHKLIKNENVRRDSVDVSSKLNSSKRKNSVVPVLNEERCCVVESKEKINIEEKLKEVYEEKKIEMQELKKSSAVKRIIIVLSVLYDFIIVFFWVLNHLWVFVSLAFVLNSLWYLFLVPLTLCVFVLYFIEMTLLIIGETIPLLILVKEKLYDTKK